MNYNYIKLFRYFDSLLIPERTIDGKKICFVVFGENDVALNIIKNSGIKKNRVKIFFVPNTKPPIRTYMTGEYRKEIRSSNLGLRPVRGNFEDIDAIEGRHFYLDTGLYSKTLIDRFNLKMFNTKKSFTFYDKFLKNLSYINKDEYEICFLYAINLNNEFGNKIQFRKIFPILYKMKMTKLNTDFESINFDKMLLLMYDTNDETEETRRKFITMYDKKSDRNNINRVITLMKAIKPIYHKQLQNDETPEENENYYENLLKDYDINSELKNIINGDY